MPHRRRFPPRWEEPREGAAEGVQGLVLAARGEQRVAEVAEDDGIAGAEPRRAAQLGDRRVGPVLLEEAISERVRDGAVVGP